jgi:hypothetical protein
VVFHKVVWAEGLSWWMSWDWWLIKLKVGAHIWPWRQHSWGSAIAYWVLNTKFAFRRVVHWNMWIKWLFFFYFTRIKNLSRALIPCMSWVLLLSNWIVWSKFCRLRNHYLRHGVHFNWLHPIPLMNCFLGFEWRCSWLFLYSSIIIVLLVTRAVSIRLQVMILRWFSRITISCRIIIGRIFSGWKVSSCFIRVLNLLIKWKLVSKCL